MDASELFLRNGEQAGVWYCGACRRVARTEPEAARCCVPPTCACGQPARKYRTSCAECADKASQARVAALCEKARKVDWRDWSGPVVPNGTDGFASIDAALEDAELGMDVGQEATFLDLSQPVFGTRPNAMVMDAQDIVDHALDKMHEGADVGQDAIGALQEFLDSWLEQYAPDPGWIEDNTVVLVDHEDLK